MPIPDKSNSYVKDAVKTWRLPHYTFCVIESRENRTRYGGYYLVRVFPHDDRESYWLKNGPWETESGAAYSILCNLDESNRK